MNVEHLELRQRFGSVAKKKIPIELLYSAFVGSYLSQSHCTKGIQTNPPLLEVIRDNPSQKFGSILTAITPNPVRSVCIFQVLCRTS